MRKRDEILKAAVNAKRSLQRRRDRMAELHGALAAYDAGTRPDLQEDRVETMRTQVASAAAKQAREGLIYATLRWALGGAVGITENDLDL